MYALDVNRKSPKRNPWFKEWERGLLHVIESGGNLFYFLSLPPNLQAILTEGEQQWRLGNYLKLWGRKTLFDQRNCGPKRVRGIPLAFVLSILSLFGPRGRHSCRKYVTKQENLSANILVRNPGSVSGGGGTGSRKVLERLLRDRSSKKSIWFHKIVYELPDAPPSYCMHALV